MTTVSRKKEWISVGEVSKVCSQIVYFIVKQLAILGPSPALGDVPEVRILNRLVRWVKSPYGSGAERLEYEADPRPREVACAPAGTQWFIQSSSHAEGKEQAQRRFWEAVGP